MIERVSHDWRDKTPEAKARWFQSLSIEERMEILCALTDLILEANPALVHAKHVEPIPGRVQILTLPRR
jgi:hypothetical protein